LLRRVADNSTPTKKKKKKNTKPKKKEKERPLPVYLQEILSDLCILCRLSGFTTGFEILTQP
jgi:hypothetical protein